MPYTISTGTVPLRIQVPISAPTESRMKIGTTASATPCTRLSWISSHGIRLRRPTRPATPVASIRPIWLAPNEASSRYRYTAQASARTRNSSGVRACSRVGSRWAPWLTREMPAWPGLPDTQRSTCAIPSGRAGPEPGPAIGCRGPVGTTRLRYLAKAQPGSQASPVTGRCGIMGVCPERSYSMHQDANPRGCVAAALEAYRARWPAEAASVDLFARLAGDAGDPYVRERLEGHFTASSWLASRDGLRTLLTHHRKLGLWLQPGGHADGDRDLAR